MDGGEFSGRDSGGPDRCGTRDQRRAPFTIVKKPRRLGENARDVRLVVVVGGDGTLLKAASYFGGPEPPPPILGFRAGRLNWLLHFDFDKNYEDVLRAALEGESTVQKR